MISLALLSTTKPVLYQSVAKSLAATRCSAANLHVLPPNQSKAKIVLNHHQDQEPRFNPIGIEMLPGRLYEQIFGNSELKQIPRPHSVKNCIQHLRKHDLVPAELDTIYEDYRPQGPSDVVFDIPKLNGRDIDEHFLKLGHHFSDSYKDMAISLIENGQKVIDAMPQEWSSKPGWTRYEPSPAGGHIVTHIDYPLEANLVFDVETCMNDVIKHAPTLAVAVSEKAWYSWTSPRLESASSDDPRDTISLEHLIPFNPSKYQAKVIIGHNVGFDRSFMRDQYSIEESKTKFLDTLSLHMCICGLTRMQRLVKMAQKRKLKDDETMESGDLESNAWIEKSSLNNLADVYQFHCGSTISKDDREMFVEGSMQDIRENFQPLTTYCANDVKATFEVFKCLFTKFNERFPHPVTLAGMLEMSTMYLPVHTENWNKYIESSQECYDKMEKEMSGFLQNLASKACSKSEQEYSQDVWLWDLDWTTQSLVANKSKFAGWQKYLKKRLAESEDLSPDAKVQELYESKFLLRQIPPFMPGFPKWYRDICCPISKAQSLLGNREWQPGPCLISTQMRVTPKLMQLTWMGYPLHHTQKHGWGYLVPNDDPLADIIKLPEDHPYHNFPIQRLRLLCKDLPRSQLLVDEFQFDEFTTNLEDDLVQAQIDELKDNTEIGTLNLIKLLRKISKKKKVAPRFKSDYCEDVEIPGAYFFRLPHKNGPNYNVGNPLSKDFLGKIEDGALSSFDNELAKLLLSHSSSLSYWKNSQKRIKNQMVVNLNSGYDLSMGAILPRVIVAGTVTRRAVEPTWLTASNQDTSRIGSELKAMIQAPKGYCFVGADVDSQELWIASLMGDSYSYQIHGGTGLSYMTLRGSKSDKTDMHSKTASLIGISRSDAKVLNYARIYGAGQKFIERFLINTNHQLAPEEAKAKAKTIFKETKGVRRFYLKSSSNANQFGGDKSISIPIEASENVQQDQQQDPEEQRDFRLFWEGGTESATFNKLEEIACSEEPRTPVLNCQISEALEPGQDQAKDFATSRVNWAVQSSAVDFLHLVLVNMKWLFEALNIRGRFAISIHDEVRYLVREEDRYKAAFALQVSNLLVRSYFAYKLNMRDLPISVAFFSSVDIDKCLRKEVTMDCKSPSNPLGLAENYSIEEGESLDMKQILEKYSYRVKTT